jgi:hypothetical protein
MLRQVRYGQLEVTCSALWLTQHLQADKLTIAEQALGDETKHCFKPSIGIYTSQWQFPSSWFDRNALWAGDRPRRELNGTDLFNAVLAPSLAAGGYDTAKAARDALLSAQDSRLLPEGSTWDRETAAFFPLTGSGLGKPVKSPQRVLYNFDDKFTGLGLVARPVGCPANSELVDFKLRLRSPFLKGYVFASAEGGRVDGPNQFVFPSNTLALNLAFVKPFLLGLVPETIRVAVTARCALFAPDGG